MQHEHKLLDIFVATSAIVYVWIKVSDWAMALSCEFENLLYCHETQQLSLHLLIICHSTLLYLSAHTLHIIFILCNYLHTV